MLNILIVLVAPAPKRMKSDDTKVNQAGSSYIENKSNNDAGTLSLYQH